MIDEKLRERLAEAGYSGVLCGDQRATRWGDFLEPYNETQVEWRLIVDAIVSDLEKTHKIVTNEWFSAVSGWLKPFQEDDADVAFDPDDYPLI